MESAIRPASMTALLPAVRWNLNWFERLLVAIAVLDISIQVDTYLFYQDQWAAFGAIGGINISLATISLGALYTLWLVESAVGTAYGKRGSLYFNLPLTLYMGVATISLLAAGNKLLAFNSLALLGQSYLLFAYVTNRITTRDNVVYIVCLFAVALAIQGLAMIGLRVIGHNVSLGPVSGTIDDMRVAGTIGSPVTGGSFLALMIAPTLALVAMPVKPSYRMLAMAALGLGGLGLLFTLTRGAWIAVGLSVSLFLAISWYRGWISARLPFVCACVALVGVIVFHDSITNRVFGDDEGSAHGRIPLYQMAWAMICDHPITGVGINNCAASAGEYATRPEMRGEWFWTIHNRYLLEWVETGVFGLVMYLVFLVSTVWKGWQVWRRNDRLLSPLALALILAISGQMVHMLVDVFNSRPQVQSLWLCAALVAAIGRIGEEK